MVLNPFVLFSPRKDKVHKFYFFSYWTIQPDNFHEQIATYHDIYTV